MSAFGWLITAFGVLMACVAMFTYVQILRRDNQTRQQVQTHATLTRQYRDTV